MTDRLWEIKKAIRTYKPLIHCITNPISINDCANLALAAGAKPIMAEHPGEVEEIVQNAAALAVNLGNITDVRMKSMLAAGKAAAGLNIPIVMDLVGVACSNLRLTFARKFLSEIKVDVLKGNMSEIRAICGQTSHAKGIDVGSDDFVSEENRAEQLSLMRRLAERTGAVVMATGSVDLLAGKTRGAAVRSGVPMLAEITGTGCMLNVLIACCMAGQKLAAQNQLDFYRIYNGNIIKDYDKPSENSEDYFHAGLLACLWMGLAGEKAAETAKGPGSFRTELLDSVYGLSTEAFAATERIKEYSNGL